MTLKFASHIACLAVGITLLAPSSYAAKSSIESGVNLGAMCYLKAGQQDAQAFNLTAAEKKETPFNNDPTEVQNIKTKLSIASLTKLLTTHWAVMKLGPEYRFKTQAIVTPGAEIGHCNIHFRGDMDPYMGREMLIRLFAQLKPTVEGKGCKFVDSFSYDENFQVYLNVFSHHGGDESVAWIDPARIFKKEKTQSDFADFVKIRSGMTGNLDNVGPINRAKFDEYLKTVPYTAYSVKSRPLYMMLKDINKYSFNYPPTVLFEKLGGAKGYAQFIQDRLGYSSDSVEIYNGSGYPQMIEDKKFYNKISCAALVHVIQDLALTLEKYKGSRTFQLADVMAVGGQGETYSTFKKLYGSDTFDNTMVAKTGSADNTITFGGMISTSEGDLYFAVLTAPRAGRSANARLVIRELVQALLQRGKTKKFDYTQIGDMTPFDDQATLVEEPLAIPKLSEVLRLMMR